LATESRFSYERDGIQLDASPSVCDRKAVSQSARCGAPRRSESRTPSLLLPLERARITPDKRFGALRQRLRRGFEFGLGSCPTFVALVTVRAANGGIQNFGLVTMITRA
jgi:hypothetical protein